MKKFFEISVLWVAVITANSWIGANALADSIETEPVLVFRIVNSVQVPNEVLMGAQKHVEYIYRKSGVRIEWLSNDAQPRTPNGRKRLELTIRVVSQPLAETRGLADHATGLAISNDGMPGRIAYIFADRVEGEAKTVSQRRDLSKSLAHSLILGYVIAHETGHLMLPRGHTPNGIMRARIDMESVDRALHGRLLFLPHQSKLIRAALNGNAGY